MNINGTYMPEYKLPRYPYNTRIEIECTPIEQDAIHNWINENNIPCSLVPRYDCLVVYATEQNATAIVMSFS